MITLVLLLIVSVRYKTRIIEHQLFRDTTAINESAPKSIIFCINIQVHRILRYPKIMLLSSFAVRDCNVIVIKESSLRPSLIEQTIALYSEVGDIVIFPWLPDAEMLAIAHRFKNITIARIAC